MTHLDDLHPVGSALRAGRRRRPPTPLLVVGGIEAGLKIAALVDLAQRSPREVAGSKRAWAVALVAVNSFGVLPLVYFLRGRRPAPAGRWGRRRRGA